MIRALWITAACVAALATNAAARPVLPPQASDAVAADMRPVLLRDLQIIDGTGAQAIPRGWVLIERGRIARMGHGAAPAIKGAQVMSLPGHSVYPGLSEMHAHIGRVEQAKWMLKLMLANGVTNVKVPGNWGDEKTGVHHETNIRAWLKTDADAPHTYMSGTTMGGSPGAYVKAGPQMQAFLHNNLKLGVDFLKSYETVEPAAMKQAADFAKAHDIYLTGHTPDVLTSTQSIDDGLVIIEHLTLRPREVVADEKAPKDFWADVDLASPRVKATLDAWAKRKDRFFIDPTVMVYKVRYQLDQRLPAASRTQANEIVSPAIQAQREAGQDPVFIKPPAMPWTDAAKARAERDIANRAAFVAAAYRRGVRILTGSDMPQSRMPPGEILLQELDVLVSGGLTPEQAINASTGTAAQAFRRSDRGLIAPGQAADLVIVKGDVAHDIHATRNIEHVVLGGRFLDPNALLDEARVLATADTAPLRPGEP